MDDTDRAIAAYQAGDYDEAVRLLVPASQPVVDADGVRQPPEFIVMFVWKLLAAAHPPALTALAAVRDELVAYALAGGMFPPRFEGDHERSPFPEIARLNEDLADPAASHALFLTMLQRTPHIADQYALTALPAIVAVRDFALAERFLPDPMAWLAELNATARSAPLLPAPGEAPRLAADLSNYARQVGLRMAILAGLDRQAEAAACRVAALAGIESPDLRAAAGREIAEPGWISRSVGEHKARIEAENGGS